MNTRGCAVSGIQGNKHGQMAQARCSTLPPHFPATAGNVERRQRHARANCSTAATPRRRSASSNRSLPTSGRRRPADDARHVSLRFGRPRHSLIHYERAYALDKNPVALFPLGFAYLQLAMFGSALHAFTESNRRGLPLPDEMQPTVAQLRKDVGDMASQCACRWRRQLRACATWSAAHAGWIAVSLPAPWTQTAPPSGCSVHGLPRTTTWPWRSSSTANLLQPSLNPAGPRARSREHHGCWQPGALPGVERRTRRCRRGVAFTPHAHADRSAGRRAEAGRGSRGHGRRRECPASAAAAGRLVAGSDGR